MALPNPAMLESAIRRLSRSELANLCEQLIDRIDAMEPDPDTEPNGDELDGTCGKDDFHVHNLPAHLQGPGCPVSDPDCAMDDAGCDEDFDQEHDYRTAPRLIYGDDQRRVMANTPVGVMEQYRQG